MLLHPQASVNGVLIPLCAHRHSLAVILWPLFPSHADTHIHLNLISYGHKCWDNPSSLSQNFEQETYTSRAISLLAMRWEIQTRYWMENKSMKYFSDTALAMEYL